MPVGGGGGGPQMGVNRPRWFGPDWSRVPTQGSLHQEVEVQRRTDRPDTERSRREDHRDNLLRRRANATATVPRYRAHG